MIGHEKNISFLNPKGHKKLCSFGISNVKYIYLFITKRVTFKLTTNDLLLINLYHKVLFRYMYVHKYIIEKANCQKLNEYDRLVATTRVTNSNTGYCLVGASVHKIN